MPMLPKTQLTIKGNRMVGGGLAQQLTKKKAVNSSDIVANFYQNSCMSKVSLSSMLPEVQKMIQGIDGSSDTSIYH